MTRTYPTAHGTAPGQTSLTTAHGTAPGQTGLTNPEGVTDAVRFNPAHARRVLELASKAHKVSTPTATGEITLDSLALSNAVCLLELRGAAAWPCFTDSQKAVLLARKVVTKTDRF